MPKAILFGVLLFAGATLVSSALWLVAAIDMGEMPVPAWPIFAIVGVFLVAMIIGWLHYRRLSYDDGNTTYPIEQLHLTVISCLGLYFLALGLPEVVSATWHIFQILGISNPDGFSPVINAVQRQIPGFVTSAIGLVFLLFPRFFYRLSTRFHGETARPANTGTGEGDQPCDTRQQS